MKREWLWRALALGVGIAVGIGINGRYRVLENRRIDSWTGRAWVLEDHAPVYSVLQSGERRPPTKWTWVQVKEPN